MMAPGDPIERLLPDARGAGGTVVAVRDRRTGDGLRVWTRGELPAGAESVFEIGSITKTVTATLLADLAAAGVVGLDDDVADHLPVAPPVVGRPITLTDLATHHSGLPRLPAGSLLRGATVERHDPYAGFDEERLLRAVAETRPRRPPGRRFGYSNYGVGLLGFALARACGTTYPRLVAERITGPLGLDDTATEIPPEAAHRLAPGHGRGGRPAHPWDLAELAGAGGLRSTVLDLHGLLALHAPEDGRDAGVPSSLVAAAHETARERYAVGSGLGIGLAWLVLRGGTGPARTRIATDALFHDGGTGGYRSFAGVVPATGNAVVVLTSHAREVSATGLRILWSLA